MAKFVKRELKRGDAVGFKVKQGNQLVTLKGEIKEIMPASIARGRGIPINRSGRVLKIKSGNRIYYKQQSTVFDPKRVEGE